MASTGTDFEQQSILTDNEIVGTNKADTLVWDARHSVGSTETATLDGGAGYDSLTILLTASQLAALKAEINLHSDVFLTDDGRLIGDGLSAFTGNRFTALESLGLSVKSWENSIKLSPNRAPIVTKSLPPPPTYIDEYNRGNFLAEDKSIDLDLSAVIPTLEFEEDPQSAVVTKARRGRLLHGRHRSAGLQFRAVDLHRLEPLGPDDRQRQQQHFFR